MIWRVFSALAVRGRPLVGQGEPLAGLLGCCRRRGGEGRRGDEVGNALGGQGKAIRVVDTGRIERVLEPV